MQFSLASAAFAPGAAGPSMIHAGRSAVRMQVAPPPEKTSGSISAMSEQMKEMRAKMEEDESTKAMMQALRGTNLNDDDSAAQGTTLRVVETRAGDDQLPLTYQPELLADYFGKRPLAVLTRIGQIMGTSAGWLSGVAIRALKGELAPGSAAEVESVAELRSIIVSLGPFFIKLGQALSIRPDILSPQAMVELQQLCDKVPSFDSALAMQTIRDELGVKDVSEVYSEITAEPVAAASLAQVYRAVLKETGEVVAVKVQRPEVQSTVSKDLYVLRRAAEVYQGLVGRFAPQQRRTLESCDARPHTSHPLLPSAGSRRSSAPTTSRCSTSGRWASTPSSTSRTRGRTWTRCASSSTRRACATSGSRRCTRSTRAAACS